MREEYEDYYKILQVHFMAEPEIIKSAYLRLSRKYHPDVNASEHAEERMKAINRAYEVLGDPVSRKQYLVRWMENFSALRSDRQPDAAMHPLDFTVEPGRQVLLAYLEQISKGAFSAAFELISDYDKKNILREDFIRWQKIVAEVFQLQKYTSELQSVNADMALKGGRFETVLELKVYAREYNHIMGRHEDDVFTKCVVLENGRWHVFLGYNELGAVIQRFNELASLKNRRVVSRISMKKRMGLDTVSGALKRKDFHEKALYEQKRFNRYGNRFSVVFCCLRPAWTSEMAKEALLKEVETAIVGRIRDMDACCRWKENTYAILLPETGQMAARKVANKLRRAIEGRVERLETNFVVAEQRYSSLLELFNRIEGLI